MRPGDLSFDEEPRGFLQFRLGSILIHHPDSGEDGLIQFPAHVVACGPVELVWVAEEFQPPLEEVGPDTDVVVDGGEPSLQTGTLAFNLGDLLARFRTGEATICNEVDEVVRPGLQTGDLHLDLIAKLSLRTGLVFERVVDLAVHPLDEVRVKLHGAVVLDHPVLNEVEGEVAGLADSVLSTAAEEVKVLPTVSPNRALNEHAFVDEPAFGVTLAAPQ